MISSARNNILLHRSEYRSFVVIFQYSEMMRKITNGGSEDLFKSFDLTINGDFSVPKKTTNFFEYKQFFLLAGMVPMTFGMNNHFLLYKYSSLCLNNSTDASNLY